jgi:uncharacterized protein (TIGR03437 family)
VAAATAPAIFVNQGRAIALNQDFKLNTASNPAKAGTYISVYFAGQGAFRPAVAVGAAAPHSPLAYTAAETSASIGGRSAEVTFSWGAPGFAGVAQANIAVPNGITKRDYQLVLRVGGMSSNSGMISVTP